MPPSFLLNVFFNGDAEISGELLMFLGCVNTKTKVLSLLICFGAPTTEH